MPFGGLQVLRDVLLVRDEQTLLDVDEIEIQFVNPLFFIIFEAVLLHIAKMFLSIAALCQLRLAFSVREVLWAECNFTSVELSLGLIVDDGVLVVLRKHLLLALCVLVF